LFDQLQLRENCFNLPKEVSSWALLTLLSYFNLMRKQKLENLRFFGVLIFNASMIIN
jgi:hypothetical protein